MGREAAGDKMVYTHKKSRPRPAFFVEYRGVEPLTYRLRTYRSSQLS